MPRPRSDIEPRLVAAARARFLSDGVDGASLRAIAADAGTSIGMIYYYFPTKDELFLAVVEEAYEKLVQDLDRALDPALPVRDRLERMFARVGALTDEEQVLEAAALDLKGVADVVRLGLNALVRDWRDDPAVASRRCGVAARRTSLTLTPIGSGGGAS